MIEQTLQDLITAVRANTARVRPRVLVSFSGGRTSAVMLDQILAKWGSTHDIRIIFANTGKEEEETLRFVNAVDVNFCQPRGHRVIWIEAVITHQKGIGAQAKEVTYETAARNGEPFEEAIKKHGLFNKNYPNCTGRLKDEPIHWYVKNVIGWEKGSYFTAIGIRVDEIDRVSSKRVEKKFLYPLADWGWRKRDVNQYMQRFEWDLKLPGDHWGNCDACWKKSFRKLMTRAKEKPEVFDWWAKMEDQYGHIYRGKAQEQDRVFFRSRKSAREILQMAETTEFELYQDDKFDNPDHRDGWWDEGSGCGESCEIGADE